MVKRKTHRLKKNRTGNATTINYLTDDPQSDKRRACSTKRKQTKTQARSAASELTKRHGVKFDYYRCDYCGKYHVGKRPDGAFGPDGKRFLLMDYFPVDQEPEKA
jgi:hypothetical protein